MYVTPKGSSDEVERLVVEFLKGGGRFVQLRIKNETEDYIYKMAQRILAVCNTYKSTFILNDYVEIALRVGAHGVHLGREDMSVDEARRLLGTEKIIGATANTLDEMIYLASGGVDYLGVGPFRYTTTKSNLSPLIGLEGYRSLLSQFRSLGYTTPVTSIGGIVLDDVENIMATGVDGIAVSGALSKSNDVSATTQAFLRII